MDSFWGDRHTAKGNWGGMRANAWECKKGVSWRLGTVQCSEIDLNILRSNYRLPTGPMTNQLVRGLKLLYLIRP